VSVQIAPSILSADFTELGKAVRAVEQGGADAIHVDVMDGHFVPNLSIGPPVISSIKRTARVPLDVHLMIEDPYRYLEAFAKAGANTLSIHVEAQPNLSQALTSINMAIENIEPNIIPEFFLLKAKIALAQGDVVNGKKNLELAIYTGLSPNDREEAVTLLRSISRSY